jgi:hypothetical protein
MCNDKPCSKCANYNTPACAGEGQRGMFIEDYEYDCFVTEEDKLLCELMCGGVEDEI